MFDVDSASFWCYLREGTLIELIVYDQLRSARTVTRQTLSAFTIINQLNQRSLSQTSNLKPSRKAYNHFEIFPAVRQTHVKVRRVLTCPCIVAEVAGKVSF